MTVGTVVGQIGAGRALDGVLGDHPYLEHNDIPQALRYVAWWADEREIVLRSA